MDVNGIYKTVWAIIKKNCLSPVYTEITIAHDV
jgi:hypothetical protein